jgi:polar amino acid transport system substrate-binding protein
MADTSFSEAQFESGHGIRCRRDPGFHRRTGRPRPSARWRLALVCLTAALLAGCDAIPRDSAGALNRVRGGELRGGVADNPPWVRFEDGRVTGLEPELIEAWAKELGARVIWRRGAESELVEALHRREVDVLAAGLNSETPYKSKLGLTQPYVEVEDRYGSKKKHVLAVTQGESALLFSLDRFLAAQDKAELRRRAQQTQQESAQP